MSAANPAAEVRALRVLVVEDFEPDATLMANALTPLGRRTELHRVDNAAAFQAALDAGGWDLVLADWSVPGFSGMEALEMVRARGHDVPFLIVSGTVDEECAVAAMRAGAHDFISKTRMARLAPAVERELREAELRASRRHLQTQLLLSERMASLGLVAASIGHEINNPLSVVVGNVYLVRHRLTRLLEQAAPALTQELPDVLSRLADIDEAAARMKHVVADLKVFSRVDEQGPALVDPRVPLASSMRLASIETRHRATLVTEVGDVPLVEANEARLGQVFTNLLINAAHAIPEGHIETNQIRVAARTDAAGRAVIEIADTGCGIAPEHLPRLFEPFFTTKPLGTGTGLGLAISRRLVTELGGAIEVESAVGKGTTMRVIVPPAAAAARPAAPLPRVAAPPRRGRVLIVDDDPLVGRTVHRLLAHHHDPVFEPDPRAALERIAQGEAFDVVLCDLMMPTMTGMDFYAALEPIAPGLRERVVFTSGGAFTRGAQEFLALVPNRRLAKPFTVTELNQIVAELLESACAVREAPPSLGHRGPVVTDDDVGSVVRSR